MCDPRNQGQPLTSMSIVTVEEVRKLILSMTSNSSPLNYVPMSLIKACPAVFSELFAHLTNMSFRKECFPQQCKQAQVMPLIKRDRMDNDMPANYHTYQI